MELLTKRKDFRISKDIFQKIIRDWKSEIKENKKSIQKMNEIDYKYNEKVVYVDKLIETIDSFNEKEICEKETKNIVVGYYGDPCVTIQLCLSALLNCQMMNLVVDDLCLGVNKLLIELYKEVLKEYRIFDIISFNNYESKECFEKNKDIIDKMYCLGNRNLYTVCKYIEGLNIEYVPFNIIDIYCEDGELYELARQIFQICFENGIEAEIYEDILYEDAINTINDYGEKYCSIILTKNKEYMERFKKEVKSKFIFVNESPFKDGFNLIPDIL